MFVSVYHTVPAMMDEAMEYLEKRQVNVFYETTGLLVLFF